MGKTFMAAAAVVLMLAMCTARATVTSGQPADSAGAAELVQQAFSDINHNDIASAQAKLDKAVQATDFDTLSADLRYRALLVDSLMAQQDGDNTKAHDLSVRATAFDEADDVAWMARLSAAFSIHDYDDAGHSLAVFAQRWPGKLDGLSADAIWHVHHELKQAQDSEVDRQLLDSLFDAGWQDNGAEPSPLWRDLALMHIEHDEIARATTVALRITSSQVALSMRVDKRFDPITLKHPEAFDVDRLIASEIKAAEQRVAAHPDQLEPITDLQELLLITRQYPRVLSISDAVVAHAERGDGSKTYKDFDNEYNWVLDNRSRAFKRQGRWEDAIRVETLAARRPEQGSMNVSQLINLGELCADIDKPDMAANAIIELGNMTPFGRMQLESVKLRIAIGKHDDAAARAAMDYLREHRADAIAAWEDALLLRGQLDEAAALLIERLENPLWRNDALVDMQHYADVTETPMDKTVQDNLATIIARPDVQTAVQKVGRVENFDITAELR